MNTFDDSVGEPLLNYNATATATVVVAVVAAVVAVVAAAAIIVDRSLL